MPRKVSEDWNTLLCLWAVKRLGTTRAQNRSLLSGDTTHHSLGTQQVCGYCQVIQEDGATVQPLGTNPERPRFTPYLSSTAVLQGSGSGHLPGGKLPVLPALHRGNLVDSLMGCHRQDLGSSCAQRPLPQVRQEI